MIKKLLLLFIVVSVVGCSKEPQEILNENLKNYMQENAKDPSGYEQLETTFIDTVFVHEMIEINIESKQDELARVKDDISRYEKTIMGREKEMEVEQYESVKELYREFISEDKGRIQTAQQEIEKIQGELDSLNAIEKPENEIAYIMATHKCRLKNGFGALDLSHLYVLTNEELQVLEISEEQSDIILKVSERFDEEYLNL